MLASTACSEPTVSPVILRLALPSPLRRLFDYLPPAGVPATVLQPGDRTILFIQTQFSKKVMQYFKGRE